MPQGLMGGYHTHWRAEGTGQRPALFLHCSLGHSGAWGGLVSVFKPDLKIIAMDLPGHGHSGPWDRDMGWQEQSARMAIALLETFEAPADIIGHSFGATVALRIAVTRPELVRSLTLAEPVLFSAAQETGRPEFERHLEEVEMMPKWLAIGKKEKVAQYFSKMWGTGQPWSDIAETQRHYMMDRIEIIITGAQSVFGVGEDVLSLGQISEIKAPVLLLEGDKTHEIIPAIQDALEAALKHVERAIIPGARHMVPLTHVAEVSSKMRQFLNL